MQNKIVFSLIFSALAVVLPAQELVSYTLLVAKSKEQLTAQFGMPFIQYGARCYKVTYTTPDLSGVQDTVSGLVVVPDDDTRIYPRLVYQHGTSSSQYNVPSNYGQPGGGEGDIPVFFAGMGYISLAPDYLGLGDSEGFHPYLHAASETWVALDLLRAFDSLQVQIDVHANDQVFVTGYSQGGHSSMALHRALETDPDVEFDVTAAAHLSGPYSLGEVMFDFLLSDEVYYYPGYLSNTLLSFQTVYGNLFDQVEDVFRPPYAGLISQFYTGQLDLGNLNWQLIDLLILNEGACRPTRMLKDSIVQVVTTDPDHPIHEALRENNVHQWGPQAPTRLFYCKADDQVPYQNSLVTLDTMLAYGAADLEAEDQDSTANHTQCVEPAVIATFFFFLGYQQIGEVSYAGEISLPVPDVLSVQPNPAHEYVQVYVGAEGELMVYDITGRLVLQRSLQKSMTQIPVGDLRQGNYLFVLRNEDEGEVERVVVGR